MALSVRSLCLWHKVVVAMRTILITLIPLVVDLLAKHFLALLACKGHLCRLLKLMVWTCFLMAFRTVEPPFAARGADRDLGVQNVFAHFSVI